MQFSGIKRTSAAEEIFKTLHEWIMSERLTPGDRLPSQDELARQFGVSRNTLREAINKLTVMGLVTTRQGVGTVINVTSAASYVSSLSDHLLLRPSTVREFLEARVFVEKTTVCLAAKRATSEDIKALKDIIRQQKSAFKKGDIAGFSRLDARFHMKLAQACKNSVLTKFLETVWELLNQFILEVAVLPGSIDNAMHFHEKIVESLIAHDVEKAEISMVNHLSDVVNTIARSTDIDLAKDPLFEMVRK